ncbi:MAG TPA: NAD(P)/FAD-dependent oxidoreductase [Bryobacteraceae bacterium]
MNRREVIGGPWLVVGASAVALVFDAIVIGGGAAGLLCAIEAGKRGRRVAVVEHADRAGKKILISGGGRANFTNLYCRPENFLSANPHFAKSALARYGPADFIRMVERHNIPYHEKKLGQLFCDRSAQDITNMLERECRQAGVKIFLGTRVNEIVRTTTFVLRTASQEFQAPAVVIATGGLSIPKMGATSFGYDIARQFGLAIRECRPALAPIVFTAEDRRRYCDLAGVSTEVVASAGKHRFREKMLITHHGLSGPAILQISSYWKRPDPILIDLLPDRDLTVGIGRRDLNAMRSALRTHLPQRLADRWLDLNPPQGWNQESLLDYDRRLHRWEVTPADTEGYAKAEVTAGGVDTDELSAKTMESRKVPGLFFIGEVVDVTGHLGGFNFQWAWSSGFCAAQAL